MTYTRYSCSKCGGTGVQHRQPAGSGWQVRLVCIECGHAASTSLKLTDDLRRWLPHMPLHDPRGRMDQSCCVCGKTGPTECHHLAPRAIFKEEAEHWPTVDVCGDCHKRWHRLMRKAAR